MIVRRLFSMLLLCSMALSSQLVLAQTSVRTGIDFMIAEEQVQLLSGDLEAAFYEILDRYDREIRARPYDVALMVERCNFLDEISYTYEYDLWVYPVYELQADCVAGLERDWGNHPEVLLNGFEYLYGEELLEAALPYDYPANRAGWTVQQLARLYELLAVAADNIGNPDAGAFARRAVDLDAAASVRVMAAESLVAEDRINDALSVLDSPLAPDRQDGNYLYDMRELRLLASVDRRERFLDYYQELRDQDAYYDASEAARLLLDAGEIDLARAEFQAAAEYVNYNAYPLQELFDFELAFGTGEQAMAAYERWRTQGWIADPVGINRFALVLADSSQPLKPRDLLGFLGAALMLLLLAAAALVPVSVAHYRGAVLKVRGLRSPESSGWRLRHAWYALFALGLASIIPMYSVGSLDVIQSTGVGWVNVASTKDLARYFLLETLIFLLLLLPLCRMAVRGSGTWVADSWSIARCVLFAVSIALLLRVPFFLYWLSSSDAGSESFSNSLIWKLIGDTGQTFGTFTALWLVAVVAPIAEEIAFRGVLLRSFAKNMSFGFANLFQASLFALLHLELPSAPLLLLLGLTAGFLAKRSGGLLAPILLHAVFNLFVGVFMFAGGQAG